MDIKRAVYKIIAKFIKYKHKLIPSELLTYMLLHDGIEQCKDKVEYLFLGSSNGAIGINTNLFSNNKAFNLCISSQDLYYSCELYKKYVKELKNLKNVFVTYSIFSSGLELQKTSNSRYIHYYKEAFGIPFKYENLPGGG